jgi:hypothetical protein
MGGIITVSCCFVFFGPAMAFFLWVVVVVVVYPRMPPANSQRSRLRWAMGKFDGWLISAVRTFDIRGDV